ncbi:MAG: hypothetical protein OHK0037_11760 [Elainellaceae cyanobacterium]
MTKSNASTKLTEVPKSPEEIQREKQRMYDVLFLLDQLFHREEATVKMVLGCLYDVGAVNLINQKLTYRPLNRLGKGTARLSKPVFTAIAIRWFHKNVPQLLVDWLHSKVGFEPEEPDAEAVKAELQDRATAQDAELIQPAAVAPDQTALLPEGTAPRLQPISPDEASYSPVVLELQPAVLQTNQANGKAAIAQPIDQLAPQNGIHYAADSPPLVAMSAVSQPVTRSVEHSTVVASVAPVPAASSISLKEAETMSRTAALAAMEEYRQEITRLRSRVNYLAIALISISGILSSALLWVVTNPAANTVEVETRPQPVLRQPAIGSGAME